MKIEELRVGNLIYFPFHNENVKVLGLGLKNDLSKLIQVETKGTILMDRLICFKPIPLTEEWLLKFGFEIEFDDPIKHARIGNNPVNRNSILKLTNCDADLENGIWFYRNGFHKIKHVNQLQNLYFALTGQELCEAR